MSNNKRIRGQLYSFKKKLVLTGALLVASSSFSGVSAQNNTTQDKQQNKQENVVSKKQKGNSYCNLSGKVWDMYRLAYSDGAFFNTVHKENTQKCRDFFEKHPDIKQICQNADEAIGGTIRGPRSIDVAERSYQDLRGELNKKLSQNIINEIDGIGDVKALADNENTTDMVWRMYTYVSTHGGVGKQNPSADFFKKYPELYEVCEDAGLAMKNIEIPLERTTYSDVMHYNLKSDKPFNMSDDDLEARNFDELVNYTLHKIVKNKGGSEKQIRRDAEDVKVPDASKQTGKYKSVSNAFINGF